MNRVIKLLSVLFLLIAFISCDDGSYCTSTEPRCCNDVIFGCGPFDLPFGCTCDDFGFSAERSLQLAKSLPNSSLNKLWDGKLYKTYSSCIALKPSITGNVQLIENKRFITVKVPQFGKLRGKKTARGFSATGFYQTGAACSARVTAKGERRAARKYKVRTTISYSCQRSLVCTAKYSGNFSKK